MSDFNQPVSGLVTPRFGGIATFMRLPHVPLDHPRACFSPASTTASDNRSSLMPPSPRR